MTFVPTATYLKDVDTSGAAAFGIVHSLVSSISMSINLDQLTDDAMKLPLRDRVQLAQRLVSTIDDEIEADTENLWFAAAERRLEELRSGRVQGIESEEVFRTAREALER